MSRSLSPELSRQPNQVELIFRNVSMNYLVTSAELLIGLFMLPFNVAYLGQTNYGLWFLVASVTVYFSMLEMGYGVALMKSTAQYRAQGDTEALNQIASTMFCVFGGIALLTYTLAVLLAFNLEQLFRLTSEQAATGRNILLVIGAYVALGFPFSVFGGIVNGFQRAYLNGLVALVTTILTAIVNVSVLVAGYGLIELVAATTTVRILSYVAYALNAYRVFPQLRIRLGYVRYIRLREVTGFSIFILLIDLANKLNYSTDTIVIGAFVGATGVAIWAVAQRLIEVVQRITNQLNGALFPVVVDSSTIQNVDRLQKILLQGTRLSLAMVILLATCLALLARPVVTAWVGPDFAASIPIIQILAIAVTLRVANATSTTLLKGSGKHELLAISNIAMALSNLALSLLLVRPYGLVGVAAGTLIPMAVFSCLILFPGACRRVNMSPLEVFLKAIWPAVWPAVIMAAFLLITRSAVGTGWPLIFLRAFVAALIYVGLFLRFALTPSERKWYIDKAGELLKASRPSPPSETEVSINL